ncbi:MAG: hypothetical protein QOJ65_2633, partial [Fimbriimonadaceae bacterium]|nr:hypothetical protein [Fimbriimonadaceae bacterium]
MAQAARRNTFWNRQAIREALWLSLTAILGHITLAALLAAGSLIVFFVLADVVAEGETRAFDVAVVHYFHVHQPPWMHNVTLNITALANGSTVMSVLIVATLFLVLMKRIWPDAVALLLAGAGGWGFVELAKTAFHRARPAYGAATIGYSFPSGHSFLSVVVYGMLAYYLGLNMERRAQRFIWTVACILILLVGSSRVLLGVHYPSDVIAGFAAGAAWLWNCLALRRLFRKRDWRTWREERLANLAMARGILESLAPMRPQIESLAKTLLHDPSLGFRSRLLLRSGLALQAVYKMLANKERLERRPNDLVVL